MIRGKAPKGATLRLRKEFSTPTWDSSFIDSLDSTMQVPSNGKYTWHTNQSTRPVVQDKLIQITEDKPVRSETYQGGPTTIGQSVDHPFTITESGIDVLQVDLDWPTPDDFDLEVYRKGADGSLTQVGSSGNFVAEKERAEIAAPEAGDYVLRVINFASTAPTYTLTATLFDSTLVDSTEVPGLIENWTMTCEKDGRVLQKESVVVDRGQQAKVDWTECAKKF